MTRPRREPGSAPAGATPALQGERLALATLGHDLREPLRKIVREVELLRAAQAQDMSEATVRSLDAVLASARRMTGLVRAMLAIAAAEHVPPRHEPVALGEVLEEAIDDLAVPIARSRARIRLGRLPVVLGERVLLRVVAQNLVQNAVRYSRPDEPPRIEVRAAADRWGRRGFAVLDRGIGLAAPPRPARLVEPNDPFAAGHGWGLGLQLARTVAARHRGVLAIAPRRAGGTRAALLVPAGPA